ncbi:hypothetical protein C1879_10510 [Paraeggerthella hongkongensis]|uniref:hypothetical protein n=1 Tax=Paraeggerthella sp. TaxID=2897350 RepID=UPI000DF73404|nr:hypothetical protein C1879_10510 [Paraeggerthella hongkongensis]
MKKHISLDVREDAYLFKMKEESGGEAAEFLIGRPALEFNTTDYYKTFFKDYTEGCEFEFQEEDADWDKETSYVYGVVKEISEGVCEKLSQSEEAKA